MGGGGKQNTVIDHVSATPSGSEKWVNLLVSNQSGGVLESRVFQDHQQLLYTQHFS